MSLMYVDLRCLGTSHRPMSLVSLLYILCYCPEWPDVTFACSLPGNGGGGDFGLPKNAKACVL